MLKTHMVDDVNLLKFVAEQLFGKAMQPVGNPDGGRLPRKPRCITEATTVTLVTIV